MYEYQATCTRVVDGDTYDLDIDLGLHVHVHERVRLRGVDTPETYGVKKDSEEYAAGIKATERVVELLVPGMSFIVTTHKDKKGKYGRYLVDVILPDGRNLADVLLNEGLAKAYE
jgi:micrococcal nuclease